MALSHRLHNANARRSGETIDDYIIRLEYLCKILK